MRSKPKSSPQTVPIGGTVGVGASPADSALCLTNIRTSPQLPDKVPKDYLVFATYSYLENQKRVNSEFNKQKAREARRKLAKKKFRMKLYPSAFCASQKLAFFEISNSKLVSAEERPSRCKSWSCPRCASHNAWRVRRLLENVVLLNDLEYFFTLTLSPERIPLEYRDNTHKYITMLFNKLILYLKREFKFAIPLKYIWVMEYQKNGNAHMHGMWNQYVDVNKIRKIWVSIGGGQQMFVSKARDLIRTARYVSKYLSKTFDSDYSEFYYFQKRYVISQNCIRKKTRSISSVYLWEDLVYHSYFLIKDFLLNTIASGNKDASFSFSFFDVDKNRKKKITASKKPT